MIPRCEPAYGGQARIGDREIHGLLQETWLTPRARQRRGRRRKSRNMKQPTARQSGLFGDEASRSLLDQLLSDSQLYTQSKDYRALLDFVVRLRNFAPFNA